jgi:hypothetical protein
LRAKTVVGWLVRRGRCQTGLQITANMELPSGFGKVDHSAANETTFEQRIAASKRQDVRLLGTATVRVEIVRQANSALEAPSTAAEDDEDAEPVYDLPISHEAVLKDHTKVHPFHRIPSSSSLARRPSLPSQ